MPWVIRCVNRMYWFPGAKPVKVGGKWCAPDCGEGMSISVPGDLEDIPESTPVETASLTRDRAEKLRKTKGK